MFIKYDFAKDMKDRGYFINPNDIHKVKRGAKGNIYFVSKNALKEKSFDIQKFTPGTGKLEFLISDVDLEDANNNLDHVVNSGI